MHVWISSFAIATAFFVVGGFLLLQWQKNRYRYQLLRTAVERGDPTWSFDPVQWLASLRRAVATLVLGIGLACIGTFLWTQRPLAAPPPERMAETNSAETGHRSDVSVTEQVAHMIGVNQPKRPPHKSSPEHEAWERLQKQQAIGLSFLGSGVLLALIGSVNCGFAWIERQTAFSNEVMHEIDPSPPTLQRIVEACHEKLIDSDSDCFSARIHNACSTPVEDPGGKGPKPKGVPADVLIKILSASQVQEEIGLSDEQIASIRQRGTEIQQELEPLLRQRVSSAAEELLSPEQYARLKQISYRATGANAFQDPDVVSRLKLTPKQQQDIKNIYESMAVEMEDVKHCFKGKEGEEIRFIMEEEIRTVTKGRVMNILDDGQRRLYEQLLGKEFDTSMIHLGGGPPPPKPGPKGPPPRE